VAETEGTDQATGSAGGAGSEEKRSGLALWGPLIAVSLAMFIIVVDSTMMNVAVPTIAKDLNTTVSGVQAAISIYSLVMASLMITGGKLGAIRGVKRMFVVGLIIFGVGTALAATSWSLEILILGWSVLEGIGAALMLPLAYTLVMANYSGAQRALGFGVLAGVQASAAAVGPILGGILTTYLSWRVGFAGEVVIAIAIVPFLRYMRELVTAKEGTTLDWRGTVLSAGGLFSIVLGFLLAGRYGWWEPRRPFTIGDVQLNPLGLAPTPWLIAIGLVILVLFVHWQFRREESGESPLVHMRVLANLRLFSGISTYVFRALFIAGLLFVFPLFMQSALGFSAFQSGLAILPFSAATFIVSMVSADWGSRISPKRLIQVGFVLMALGVLLYYFQVSLQMTITDMIIPMTVLGLGLGLVMPQLLNLTLSAVPPKDNAEASGLTQSLGQLGESLGVAIIGSLLTAFFLSGVVDATLRTMNVEASPQERQAAVVELEDLTEASSEEEKQKFVDSLPAEAQQELGRIVDEQTVNAMQETLVVTLVFVLLGILASTFLPNAPPREVEPEDRATIELDEAA
jgi:EmrB/QacA subfamily drug resistance transporter